MKGFLGASVVAGLVLILAQSIAQAGNGTPMADPTCEPSCGQATCCSKCPCECTEMRVCKEIVYDYEEITLYKTVYEEVKDKHEVDAVKYVEETRYRCVPATAWQPEQPCACAQPDCCGQPCQPVEKPTCYLRRVPYTAYRAVPYKKTVETPRVVVKQVPYKVTRCIPRVVCREVPVKVPCPCTCCKKPCCKRPCCEEACGEEACGETTACAP